MAQQKESKEILDKIKNKIMSTEFMEKSRISENDFTRNRKLPFCFLIYFMLNSVKQTLQKELTNFMSHFTKYDSATKSAFCQQRLKLKPEAFIELNDELIDEFYTDNVIEKWDNYRLVSIDGSTLELPKSEEIIDDFGVNSELDMVPMAKISILFDLMNELILDATIAPSRKSEYDLAIIHFDKLKEGDLLLMDRGYEARWLFYLLTIRKIDFVIRLQHGFGKDVDEFWNSKEISNLKNHIEIGNFTGYSTQVIKQDFYACQFIANIQRISS